MRLHIIQKLLLFSQIEEIYHCVYVYHVHASHMYQTNTLLCSTYFVKYDRMNWQGVVSAVIKEYK